MREHYSENTELLFRAILELGNIDECYKFFEDLCTISELKSMSQRMEVAMMLADKSVYTDIAAKTGASTATISRVNRCLNYGKDGYAMIIKRLKEKEAEEQNGEL